MRLAPPVWVAPRIATTDCIIDGVKIPKGAHVLVSQYVTHRNPRYFPEPEKWRPDRWLHSNFSQSLLSANFIANADSLPPEPNNKMFMLYFFVKIEN